jgi:hypothetical protein
MILGSCTRLNLMSDEIEAYSFLAAGSGPSTSLWLVRDPGFEDLKPLLRHIVDRIDELLNSWYSAYFLYFGQSCTLRKAEFFQIFKPALRVSLLALLGGRLVEHSAEIGRLGQVLAKRKVPPGEVVLSLQMYEESAFAIFPLSAQTIEFFRVFKKLSDIRLAILMEAYLRA